MRIAILDDDKDICLLTKRVLATHGHSVDVFHDPMPWIKHVKQNRPDLILMDIMMPGMDGAEIVKFIQTDPDIKDIPIIFLTALVSENEGNLEGEGIIIGDLKYPSIGKPYEIESLLKIIKKFA